MRHESYVVVNLNFINVILEGVALIYFQDRSDGGIRQVWYDDPDSLQIKYSLAEQLALAGVGMWEADAVDYNKSSSTWNITQKMWDAIPYKKSMKLF